MTTRLDLGGISIGVVFKDIKNLHLSVYPPTGRVHISAPQRMKLDTIRLFAISKLDWIKRQQATLRAQDRDTPREYLDRESHYLWGKRYLLRLLETDSPPSVDIDSRNILLRVRPETTLAAKQETVSQFYREQLKAAIPPLLARWTPIIGLSVEKLYVRQMRTKWGSCNPLARAIRLNTELAKKPKQCLEYILVHEMVHFHEPGHRHRFAHLMDTFMPQWRLHKDDLNRHPLAHECWKF